MKMDFGDILRSIGDFGLFQKLLLLGLTYPIFLMPFFFSSLLFIESDPERHCNTDWILAADANLTKEEQLNLTLPREQDGSFSRCRMFAPVDWDIGAIREHGLTKTAGCRDGWVYYNTMYTATIVTDFELLCDKSNTAQICQTIFMTGLLAGSIIFGPSAESFGRRRTIQIPVVLMLIFNIVTALAPNVYIYITSQFMVGVALAGYRVNASVLATEWIGCSKRSFASCMSQMFGSLGQCAVAGLIYFVRDWRTAQFIIAGAQAVVFVYIWWVPESARWLLGQRRVEEATKFLKIAAAINKQKIPESLLDEISVNGESKRGGIRTIFSSAVLVKYFLIVCFSWFSLNLGYFCLILNVANYGLNIFLVQFLFGITEAPAHFLCVSILELLGRKISLILTSQVGAFFCLLALALSQENAVGVTALLTMGKLFLSAAGSVCTIYCQELFPTSVRQTALGLASMVLRMAGLLSPLLNMLVVYHTSIPILIFSILTLVSGSLAIFLPETRRKELPDSPSDVEGNRSTTPRKTEIDPDLDDSDSLNSPKL